MPSAVEGTQLAHCKGNLSTAAQKQKGTTIP